MRKLIVVTGGSQGIGRAIIEKFVAQGFDAVTCARHAADLEVLKLQIEKLNPGANIYIQKADMSLKDDARRFGEYVLTLDRPVDVLVNNAGYFVPGEITTEPEGNLESMIGANLYSAYHLTRALAPAMKSRRSGHIFNMCSIASLKAYKNGGAYSISKFALAGFSKNLREEMKPHGIKVTAVYPGAAYTDSWAASGIDPKRVMVADDVAKMIYAASQLSVQACVEDIVLRPQLGDL